MELPQKRTRECGMECELAKKKEKSMIETREITAKNICNLLRKDILIEVLNCLDTVSVLVTIPLINTFFYNLVRDNRHCLTSLQVSLQMQDLSVFNKPDKKYLDFLSRAIQLKKLELFIYNSNTRLEFMGGRRDLQRALENMPWGGSLKVLDLGIIDYNNLILKGFLNSLLELTHLRLRMSTFFPTGLSYIFKRFVNPNGIDSEIDYFKGTPSNPIPFTPLLHLSLEYSQHCYSISTEAKIFSTLDSNTTLESFALKFTSNPFNTLGLTPSFKINQHLQVLKLSPVFHFTQENAKTFSIYLEHNKTLRHLHISKTVLLGKSFFLTAIEKNQILECLYLYNSIGKEQYVLGVEEMIKVLIALQRSKVQKFQASSEYFALDEDNFGIHLSKETIPDYMIAEILERLIENVNNLLQVSGIKKFTIGFRDIPDKYIEKLSLSIIYFADKGKLECFSGFNLKMLIQNKLDPAYIKQKKLELAAAQDFNSRNAILLKILQILT